MSPAILTRVQVIATLFAAVGIGLVAPGTADAARQPTCTIRLYPTGACAHSSAGTPSATPSRRTSSRRVVKPCATGYLGLLEPAAVRSACRRA